jgi:hypothetical protein
MGFICWMTSRAGWDRERRNIVLRVHTNAVRFFSLSLDAVCLSKASARIIITTWGGMKRTLILWAFAVFVSACGGSPTSPGTTTTTGPIVTAHGSMSATVNGVAWNATTVSATNIPGSVGFLEVVGIDLALQAVGFTLGPGQAPGTWPMIGTSPAAIGSVNTGPVGSTQSWTAGPGLGSGTIVIATLTATGASGTFSFTAPALAFTGATGTKTVTNGVFNVTF